MKGQIAQRFSITRQRILWSVLIVGVVLLSACGGGGGSGSSGASSTAGVSSGEIEAFGSILINGVKFEVEGAEVETEHGVTTVISTATQTLHLHEGMHIELEGGFDDNGRTGTATRVRINDELEGPVTAASATGGDMRMFTVLGQTVVAMRGVTQVSDSTLQPVLSIDDISVADFIEVHGLPDGSGNLQASFIKIEGPENEVELTGAIDAGTFIAGSYLEINGQPVNYSDVIVDFPPLAAGMLVEVRGTLNAQNEVDASSIHVEDGPGANLARVEIEAILRNLDTAVKTFSLNGQTVSYASATFFGGKENELQNGLKIEAEGPVNASGVLVARKVKFKESVRLEGFASWNAGADTLEYPNPTGTTLLMRVTSEMTRGIVPSADGTYRTRGRQLHGEALAANRIDSGNNADRLKVKASVVAYDETNGTVDMLEDDLNPGSGLVRFVANPGTIYKIDNGSSEDVISRETFFSTLATVIDSALVEARFRYPADLTSPPTSFNGNWDEIVIELDD